MAALVGLRSTCGRAKVGAVLAIESRVVSTGYNGPPRGHAHCQEHGCDLSKSCQISVHAEANAIAFAACEGIATKGASLFVELSPCLDCARLLINAGIVHVFYRHAYRDPSGLNLLIATGVRTTQHQGETV